MENAGQEPAEKHHVCLESKLLTNHRHLLPSHGCLPICLCFLCPTDTCVTPTYFVISGGSAHCLTSQKRKVSGWGLPKHQPQGWSLYLAFSLLFFSLDLIKKKKIPGFHHDLIEQPSIIKVETEYRASSLSSSPLKLQRLWLHFK